ncbi:L-lactate ferricytochrome c oxidoreductase [Terfezia boudieri ATCC MYA-4762]|uniref:L-lactate dehydrogenase (cytochrome) n=1 Tax=Terfezia boudieri ATCC MYA-4762 TaxID=1051890 RepID=A0A3N4LMB6_9PEZI|nr:L-lactate ferricytochrome c oxidoreductase [Terfezia boudieri ATCC MYA-4762]
MLDAKEVAKHNSRKSCWVILYGTVYDVTDFIDSHPGGANVILQLAGKDATVEYDPIHPPGLLEETLSKSQILGPVDSSTILKPPPQRPASTSPNTTSEPENPISHTPLPPLSNQLNIADFALTAEKTLSPKAWAYYFSASDDLITKEHNSSAIASILLRPRIFKDVEYVDTSIKLLGTQPSSLPLFVAPAAMARLAHPDGEAGIARACGKNGILQMVSNNASMSLEQIASARASPSQNQWFQLYVQTVREKSNKILQRVNETGYTAIVLTLDAPTPGKREADERVKNFGNTTSAISGEGVANPSVHTGEGLGRALFAGTSPNLTWADLEWLRSQTSLPIILKGIQTHEDALLAANNPLVSGILLSNHGGRAMDTASPPIYTLMEIRKYCPEVFDKVEIYIDGGVKRGTTIVKALCLGAKAVGIGRAALFGLAGYGEEGVGRVIQILREEIETCMRLLGVNSVKDLGLKHVNTSAIDHLLYKTPSYKTNVTRFVEGVKARL